MIGNKEYNENNCFKAVIFDMDGTLIDSTEADFLAWQKLFSFYKKPFIFQDYISLMGIKSAEVVNEFLPVKNEEELQTALAKKVGWLSYFDAIITAEDVTNGKPSPDIFIRAAEMLSVLPEDCLVFEDAANGVKAAKNASIKCVALASVQTPDLLYEADLIIPGFKDLDFPDLCFQLKK